jgi:hypothetical protein
MASKITGEVFSNANRRMGIQMARAVDELLKLKAENFVPGYKKICGYIDGTLLNEMETLETASELAPDDANLKATLALQISQLKKSADGMLQVLALQMKQQAAALNIPAVDLKPGEPEKKAMAVIPKATPKVKESGYSGYRQFMPQMSREQLSSAYRDIGSTSELERLCTGKHNALQIKQMLDTQYPRESSLNAILDYVELLTKAGLVSQEKPVLKK